MQLQEGTSQCGTNEYVFQRLLLSVQLSMVQAAFTSSTHDMKRHQPVAAQPAANGGPDVLVS